MTCNTISIYGKYQEKKGKLLTEEKIQEQIQLMTQDFREIITRVSLEVGNCLAGANISIWFWWVDRFVQAGGYSAGPGRCVRN